MHVCARACVCVCACVIFGLCECCLFSDIQKQHSLYAHTFYLERNEPRIEGTFWLRASIGMWKANRIRLVEG